MTELTIIDTVIEELNKYPDIEYHKKNENELLILSRDEKGFDILLQTDERENILHFGEFHWHFKNDDEETDELLNQLVFGLSGIVRLKEFSKNGKAYKWTLQIRDRDGNWSDDGTMGTINLHIRTEAEIKYFQNSFIPIPIK